MTNKFDESKHPRDKDGKFTKKEFEGMSAKELAEKEKIEIKSEFVGISTKMVLQYRNMSSKQRQKSIKNHKKQLFIHLDKIKNPEKYVEKWNEKSKRYQNGLVSFWAKEVVNMQNQIKILEKIENERE